MRLKDIRLNNVGIVSLLSFMALCPIFYDTAHKQQYGQLRLGQEQFYQLGATVLFAIVFLENIYLSLFLLWSIALYCYFNFPSIGGDYIQNIFWGLVLYQIAYKLINKDNVESVFKMVLVICALNMVWLALQLNHIDLIFLEEGKQIYTHDYVGLMGLKAFMGVFFALCLPIMAYFNPWLAVFFFIPIYLSDCSVAVLGGIASFIFTLWFKSKKLSLILILLLGIAGGLYVKRDVGSQGEMFVDRFSLWKVTMRDAFKHPFTGWGLDSFSHMGDFKPFMYFKNARTNETRAVGIEALRFHRETGQFPPMGTFVSKGDSINPWDNPHNEYVGLFYEFGLIGTLIILFMKRDMWMRFVPKPKIIALAGFFISLAIISLGQFPLHVARTACYIPIFLGIYYKLTDEDNLIQRSIDYGT